jgi:catechol 2,3-dioxygenase-like lactoylglutathione lyase family enzyme
MEELGMQRIAVVSVPVSDQDRARRFYTETLGFELVTEAELGPGMRWLQVAPAGAEVSLTLVTWFDAMPPGSLRGLVIETDDLTGDYERLMARGATFLGPPSNQPGGAFATLSDPDGNELVLRQADDPAPA